ncbi:MAG: helix-turn-helix domain-containing protein [Lachnospiraceae bacterium]|nr:helix-turn-helix domain-containing protein [Lachnospiraceae bacterium]
MSQEKLALRANITTYLGLLERNLKNPTVKVVEQICSQLNISLGDFFSSSHVPESSADAVSLQIIAQISDRSEEEKLLILQTIKDILRLCDISKNQALKDLE